MYEKKFLAFYIFDRLDVKRKKKWNRLHEGFECMYVHTYVMCHVQYL